MARAHRHLVLRLAFITAVAVTFVGLIRPVQHRQALLRPPRPAGTPPGPGQAGQGRPSYRSSAVFAQVTSKTPLAGQTDKSRPGK